MTDREMELIRMIRECDDRPGGREQALVTATAVILEFLKQLGSSEAQAVACPPEPYETNQ